jgi:hypothetical protein
MTACTERHPAAPADGLAAAAPADGLAAAAPADGLAREGQKDMPKEGTA